MGSLSLSCVLMLAVISPSKTQDFSTSAFKKYTQLRQITDSNALIAILKLKSRAEIAQLMSVSDKLAVLNYQRFQRFSTPLTLQNSKQALLAFKGDVYNPIEASNLSATDLGFAQNTLRILSGLYGVVRPLDLIAPYRLEMGTKLANPKGRNLYEFWGTSIAEALNEEESEVIVNLASNEYFKAVEQKILNAKIIHIIFKERKNDAYKVIGIYAKRARGLMVRYMIDNKITRPENLKRFDSKGYQFSQDLSNELSWVFLRG